MALEATLMDSLITLFLDAEMWTSVSGGHKCIIINLIPYDTLAAMIIGGLGY